jgi:hypothetical protein
MPADLPALAARLREAAGPDCVAPGDERATAMYRCALLNCEIAEAFGLAPAGFTRRAGGTTFDAPPVGDDPRSAGFRYPEPYTTSIDAAVELVRMLEPDMPISLHIRRDGSAHATLWRNDRTAELDEGVTPALALCLALVEWRIAHGGA